MTVRLSVSLAAAPLTSLRETVNLLNHSPVDMLHFDIEDGIFVPCITLGTKIIADLRPFSSLLFEIHLMVLDPEKMIKEVVNLGANRVTVHWEGCPYPFRTLSMIKECGVASGLAFNPKTIIPDLGFLAPVLDYVNVLSTEPQSKESPFIPDMVKKVFMNKEKEGCKNIEWEMDGGLNLQSANLAIKNGVDTLVVGRYIFEKGNISENIRALVNENSGRPVNNACTSQ